MTSHLLLSPKQIQLIQTLKKNGTSSKVISRIFNEIYDKDIILTWRQIRAINKKTDNEVFHLQTSELIDYIENINGIYKNNLHMYGDLNVNPSPHSLT